MARVRSPNYPSMSLPSAIERIRSLYKAEGKNSVAREAMAKHIGFGSLNGASATALSALAKYGLIEASGEGEARISELAMKIMHPHDQAEKDAALNEAAFKPTLFSEILEKWPDRPPSDESLRSYLARNGFSQGATEQVIQFYRETLDIVSPTNLNHSEPRQTEARASAMNIEEKSTVAEMHQAQAKVPVTAADLGKPFMVAFDGNILTGTIAIRSVRDIDRLMKVLSAQKAAFEAMQEDDDQPEIFR